MPAAANRPTATIRAAAHTGTVPTSLLLPEVPTDDDAAAAIVDTPAAVPPDAVRVGVVDTAVANLSDGGEAWRAHSAFVASIVRHLPVLTA